MARIPFYFLSRRDSALRAESCYGHIALARGRVLVGFEFAGHNGFTFVHFLAKRGHRVVSVLPFVTKRLKEVEDNSPRKDDAKDAAQFCALVARAFS